MHLMKLFLLLFSVVLLNAYDLPEINLSNDKRPEIVLFDAKNIKTGDTLSYEIKWKTINATDVNITYLGKLELSGSLIITDKEYNRGPITLRASSTNSEYVDVKTINEQKSDEALSPISKKASPNESDNAYDNLHRYNNFPRSNSLRQDIYRRRPGRYQ